MGNTDEKPNVQSKSFLETLPGLLTALATLVTAVGGCVAVLLASPKLMEALVPTQSAAIAQVTRTQTPTLSLVVTGTALSNVTPTSGITPNGVLATITNLPRTAVPPTATNLPRPTIPAPTPTPNCPPVSDPFSATWSQTRSKIGCGLGSAIKGSIAEENFQSGKMLWREPIDFHQVLVLFNDGTWKLFDHAPYVEGKPEYACVDANTPAKSPPTPRRGFGLVWCDIAQVRLGLGNATDAERGYTGYMQDFDNGFMLRTDYAVTLVFYKTGNWEKR